jgi:hypothetical protein
MLGPLFVPSLGLSGCFFVSSWYLGRRLAAIGQLQVPEIAQRCTNTMALCVLYTMRVLRA